MLLFIGWRGEMKGNKHIKDEPQHFYQGKITIDQLKLLKYDNIPSGKFKTNFDLNFPSYSNFDLEIEKYSFVWKESGEFSQAKYKKNS